MEELTLQYLGILQDSNECLKLYASYLAERDAIIKDLRAELKEKEAKLFFYMAKDSFSISRSDLRNFFITVKYRHETDAEWELFQRTFRFKLQEEIYTWIESLPLRQEQKQGSHISPECTLSEESEHALTLIADTLADEGSH